MLRLAQHERNFFNDSNICTVRPAPSTGSGLKAVEGACPEAPRRVEG